MEAGSYKIGLDGQWTLEDFYQLPHTFGQVYAFHYAFRPDAEVKDRTRLTHAFADYPWRGGFSAVNFYRVLSNQIPEEFRPIVRSIQKASPGFLELALLVAAASAIGRVVKVVVQSADSVYTLYDKIHKGLHERGLLRIDTEKKQLELLRDQMEFVKASTEQLTKVLEFHSVDQLHELTDNELTSLKILLSYCRQIKILTNYEAKGKALFPTDKG
jgi:hypothetical protein